jgi:hypothetical protein
VQSDTKTEDAACERRMQVGGVAQALTQFEGRQYRPAGMILLCHGNAEDRGKAVMGRLGQGTCVAQQYLLGQRHHGLEQTIPRFRTQPRHQGGRFGQRPTKDRHQLIFTVGVGRGRGDFKAWGNRKFWR